MLNVRPWLHTYRWWVGAAVFGLLLAGVYRWHQMPAGVYAVGSAGDAPTPAARYVGAQACAACHQSEYQAWQGSHHALAMQHATPATVLAPFKGERLTENGITSVFSQRDGRFYVRTDGPDGRMQEFEVTHILGLAPLQQYLVPMPNQGMQALTIAWDARVKEQGGQRWFHLQAGQKVQTGEALHWTGRQNNANFMCLECHTTQFKKNFNVSTRRYSSTWAEMNVACESCHGPGSKHVDWAGQSGPARLTDSSHGLAQWLDERKGVQWTVQPATGNAVRSAAPAVQRQEVELCARCHAHRSQISDDYVHGKPLLDTHEPSLLDQGLFWGDGQMKAEVYNYASFQQSKMYQKGVTCSDCHDPHTQKLKASGNQVCFQCHAPAKYDTPVHHFHALNSSGARCAACHMPTTTYMTIDPRHDHSIRVPRPDLSLKSGNPNACTQCHADKSVAWAAQWALRWYPALASRSTPLLDALAASDKGDADALALLYRVITNTEQSPIARATAVSRMAPDLGSVPSQEIAALLADKDPLVRRAVMEALAGYPPEFRAPRLLPLLADPVRGVRIAAARGLAGLPAQDWSAQDKRNFDQALAEYIAVQQFNADRPEAYNNLGMLYADMRDWAPAQAALEQAIQLDPTLSVSSLNLADVYRAQEREADAQALIRKVIQNHPRDAVARHALGLSLLRQQRSPEALVALRTASELEPDNLRFAYVYAVTLDSQGQHRRAVQLLQQELDRHPSDRDALHAVVAMCNRLSDRPCVQRYAQRLAQRDAGH